MEPYPVFETPRERWARRLDASLPLGRIAGTEVRVLLLSLAIAPPLAALVLAGAGVGGVELVVLALLLTVLLYLVVLLHELGHVVAARRLGIPAPGIALTPLGGVAHLALPPSTPRADVLVSLAGPATHLLGLAVAWPLVEVVPPDLLRPPGFSWGLAAFSVDLLLRLNLWLLVLNLLPFFPLDGGRVLRALLAGRLHPNRARIVAARVGMVGAGLILVAAVVVGGVGAGVLLAVAITTFLACRQEVRQAALEAGPWGGEPRAPWEGDPDAWKGSGASAEEVVPPRAARRAEDLDEEVDRVLARVSEVGMQGLTRAERKVLERAAERKRRGG